jgi:hypothetical protein
MLDDSNADFVGTRAFLLAGPKERQNQIAQIRTGLALTAFVDARFAGRVPTPAMIEPGEFGERRCAGKDFIDGCDDLLATVGIGIVVIFSLNDLDPSVGFGPRTSHIH